MIETLNALAEPNRFAIVELLRGGPRSVNEIVDSLGLRQPLVSKHLKVLSGAGIVAVRPEAQKRYYELERQRFDEIDGWLDSFAELWGRRLDRLEARLRATEATS
jgi:DNA-binding transcriptional ArsR family regulator